MQLEGFEVSSIIPNNKVAIHSIISYETKYIYLPGINTDRFNVYIRHTETSWHHIFEYEKRENHVCRLHIRL